MKNLKKHNNFILSVVLTLFVVGVVFAASYSKNTQSVRSIASDFTDAYVTRQGTKFYLDGKEFRFVGFNLFDTLGSGTSPYSCLTANGWFPKMSDQELSDALTTMKIQTGATVLRFWAFQKYTKNGTDFSSFDKVIKLAKDKGFKVLPVLDDGPGYCTEPGGGGNNHMAKWQYQSDTWYTAGYKIVNSGYPISYREYVQKIVTRYKDEPTIFGWMMMNEADTSKKDVVNGRNTTVLVRFAQDIGGLIKSIDKNHLVTVGTQSNGASGGTGQDFIDLYGLSVVDFAEVHDWGYWGNDNEAIPGGIKNADGTMSLPDPLSADCLKTYLAKIGCSFAQAIQIVKKPVIVGESGIAATDTATRAKRATLIDNKMKAFFDAGGAGYLYWQWNKVVDTQHYDVLATTNDPLLPVMKKYAGLEIIPSTTPNPTAAPTVTPTLVPTKTPIATATPKSTTTPVATVVPTRTPSPTTRPTTQPTVKPTATPSPTPTNTSAVLDAKTMQVTSGKYVITSDTLGLLTNATAKGTISGPIKKIVINARAQTCLGYPHIIVKIDGSFVLDTNITNTNLTDYTTNDLSYLKLGTGSHNIEVNYNNDASFVFCDRNVYLSQIKAQ